MKRVVILGANGFVGAHLTKYLAGQGYMVSALVDARFDYSGLQGLPNTECIEFSLETLETLNTDSRFDGADFLYHLAWAGVNAKDHDDAGMQLQNIPFALKVMEFCTAHHIGRVLIPGTASDVSCSRGLITGDSLPRPYDMYGVAKVSVRYLCQAYALKHGIDLICTYVTSIYGPGRDDNNLISYTIKTLLRGEKPSFTKLEQEWDYLYIDDFMLVLEALALKGKGGKVYPVASGIHMQMQEYVRIIRDLIDPGLPLGIGDLPYRNPDKIDNQVFDISALVADTGFSPRVPFEEGIRRTIDAFRKRFDYVVAGSGLSGSTFARLMAERGKRVLVVERRNEIGGNLYDERDESGILVQKYGPHIIHTSDEEVYAFLNRFAEWQPFNLRCEVDMLGQSTPSPFNFKTIDQFFPPDRAEELKKVLKTAYPDRETVTIVELLDHPDPLICDYARFLFRNDYSPYTAKQWGIKPEMVDPSVLKRVPVRLDYQQMYFTDKYECLPAAGFTAFIKQVLSHPNIEVIHDDARRLFHFDEASRKVVFDGIPVTEDCRMIYTGPIDELFSYSLGPLPYRSLRFEFERVEKDSFQSAPVVAYPQAAEITRITEYKKLPEQDVPGVTVIAREFPQAYSPDGDTDPYYPIQTKENTARYDQYKELASRYDNLVLCGRLADYKYYNMDQAIRRVLDLTKGIEV